MSWWVAYLHLVAVVQWEVYCAISFCTENTKIAPTVQSIRSSVYWEYSVICKRKELLQNMKRKYSQILDLAITVMPWICLWVSLANTAGWLWKLHPITSHVCYYYYYYYCYCFTAIMPAWQPMLERNLCWSEVLLPALPLLMAANAFVLGRRC